MTREQLLKLIAIAGYDIGFGAKTHFSTMDIVEKGPGWLGAISLVGGIYGLFVPIFATQHLAAIFVVFGVASLYIGFYSTEVGRYADAGKKLTAFFHELHTLHGAVASLPHGADASAYVQRYEDIRSNANAVGISKQIFLSDWYAHYKFFWQMQIDWINDSRPFNFWRDKIPLSAYIFLILMITAFATILLQNQIGY